MLDGGGRARRGRRLGDGGDRRGEYLVILID